MRILKWSRPKVRRYHDYVQPRPHGDGILFHVSSLHPTRIGIECPLLKLFGEKVVAERERALIDANRHRIHMTNVSEEVFKHGVEEAEECYKANLENLTENMLEERTLELRRCDEILKAGSSSDGESISETMIIL